MRNALIIDEEPVSLRKLQTLLLSAYPEIKLGTASVDAFTAIKKMSYSLVLIDTGFQNGLGNELIKLIKRKSPDTYIIVYSSFDDDQHILKALCAGANGYLLKDTADQIFIDKLRGLKNGDPPLSPSITRMLLRHYSSNNEHLSGAKKHRLSPRESEVLIYIAKGLSCKEIARLLDLADCTIAGYIKDIYRSLDISCRAEAAIQACRMGLIDPEKFH